MRYAQGGGFTAEEQVRLRAVGMFGKRLPTAQCRLDGTQLAWLEEKLRAGPLQAGYRDQRWTLARIRDLIAAEYGVDCTLPGARYLLRRNGWPCQMGTRRAAERDDARVEEWRTRARAEVKRPRRPSAPWIVFEDETGQPMRPPRARTWAPRGHTPVIRVRQGGTGSVPAAGLACYRPGFRTRLICRYHEYHGRKGETKAFTWPGYRDLVTAAHRQLPGGKIVLAWDNLNTHAQAGKLALNNRTWLRIYRPPPYVPDLNPVEGIWSVLKRGPLASLSCPVFSDFVQVHPARAAGNPASAPPHRRLPRRNRPHPGVPLSSQQTSHFKDQ